MLPLGFAVGPVGPARFDRVDPPALQVPQHPGMHVAARGGVAAQDDPDAAFAVEVAAQPVLHDRRRGQARDPRGEPGPGQLPHHPPPGLHVLHGNGPSADRAVRVGGGHQPDRKTGGKCLVRQVVKNTAVDLTARQREDHRQWLLDLGGHHITPSHSTVSSTTGLGAALS